MLLGILFLKQIMRVPAIDPGVQAVPYRVTDTQGTYSIVG
jgi:hypothetical protein